MPAPLNADQAMRGAAGLLLLVFLGVSAWIVASRDDTHTLLFLLLAEYGLLLPAAAFSLRGVGPGGLRGFGWTPSLLWVLPISFASTLLVGGLVVRHFAGGDEAAYLFQARIFGYGALAAEAPPDVAVDGQSLRQIFRFHHHVIRQDKWYTIYPPLWPAVLSLWTVAAPEWLLNPFLSVVYLLLTCRIGTLLYDRQTAALAVCAVSLSLNFQHQSSGILSHPFCGVLLAAAFLFFLRGRRSSMLANFTCAFLLLAAAGLTRPYTAVCLGSVVAFGMLLEARRHRGILVPVCVIGLTIGILAAAGYAAYNHALQGATAGYPGWSAADIFATSPVGLFRSVATNTRWSLQSTMFYSLPFLMPLAIYAAVQERSHRAATVMLGALFGSLVVGYSLTNLRSGDVYFGERYYYEGFYALCLLAARGMLRLSESRPRMALRAAVGILVVAVYAIHVGIYIHRASDTFHWRAAVRDHARQLQEPAGVVFLPPALGRDINLNAADWRRAPQIYIEDPGELLRAPVTRTLGRATWSVVFYDPASRRAHHTRASL